MLSPCTMNKMESKLTDPDVATRGLVGSYDDKSTVNFFLDVC